MKRNSTWVLAIFIGLGVGAQAYADMRFVEPAYTGEDRITVATERHGQVSFPARAVGRVLDARTVVEIEQARSCYFSWFRDCGKLKRRIEEGVWIDRLDDKNCLVSERSVPAGKIKSPEIMFHSWQIPCDRPAAVPAYSSAGAH